MVMLIAHVFAGLGIAVLQWLYAYALGFFAVESAGRAEVRERYDAVDLLIRTATGFAIQIFLLFFLAQVHVFTATSIAAVLVVALLLSIGLAGLKVARPELASRFCAPIKSAATPVWSIVFAVCAFLSAPATLPPVKYDSTMYHLAYAVEWARAGGLTVDRFLHFPLAAFNIELLYSMMYAFHLDEFVQFQTWTFFCLAATGIASLTIVLLQKLGAKPAYASAAGLVASAIYIGCPVVLSIMDTAYIDLPAGALLLAAVAAALRAKQDFSRAAFAFAVVAGCFVGTKMSLAPTLVPFVAILVISGLRYASRKQIAIAVAILFVSAAPWYVRNFAIAGDPIDPVVNVALHHTDPFWSAADLQRQRNDLDASIPFYSIPVWFYFNPSASQASVSSSYLFFYAAFILAGFLIFNRRLRDSQPELTLICCVVVWSMLVQFAESSRFARYSMPFFPLFIVLMAMTSWIAFGWLSRAIVRRDSWQFQTVAVVALLAMIVPPLVPFGDYSTLAFEYGMLDTAARYPIYYLDSVAGYQAASDLARLVSASATGQNVLDVDAQNHSYYFRREGVVSLGDWWGPGRDSDLKDAIASNGLPQYLNRLDVGAVMFARDLKLSDFDVPALISEISKAGFQDISDPESDSRVYVRPALVADAKAHGYVVPATTRDSVNFESVFDRASIFDGNDPVPGKTVGNAAFPFDVLDDGKSVRTFTVIAGNEARFPLVLSASDVRLNFSASKVFPIGSPAVGWIDVRSRAGRRRIFTETLPVADGKVPIWKSFSIPVHFDDRHVEVIFGSQSVVGGGTGDWIAFAHSSMTNAKVDTTVAVALPAASPVPLPASTDRPSGAGEAAMTGRPSLSFTTSQTKAGASFTADPNPVSLSSNDAAVVTVQWNVPNASKVEVHLGSATGKLFAAGVSTGSATTGPWVSAGATFYLQDMSGDSSGSTVAILKAR